MDQPSGKTDKSNKQEITKKQRSNQTPTKWEISVLVHATQIK